MVPFWYLEVVIMCKGKQLPKNINFLSFNVDGLKPKLEDPACFKLLTIMASLFSQKRGKLTLQKLTLKDSGIFHKYD